MKAKFVFEAFEQKSREQRKQDMLYPKLIDIRSFQDLENAVDNGLDINIISENKLKEIIEFEEKVFEKEVVEHDKGGSLAWAARRGYTKYAEMLLNAGADVHWNYDTAIEAAIMEAHPKIVKMLIDAGANVRSNDKISFWACKWGGKEIIKMLQDTGLDVYKNARIIARRYDYDVENDKIFQDPDVNEAFEEKNREQKKDAMLYPELANIKTVSELEDYIEDKDFKSVPKWKIEEIENTFLIHPSEIKKYKAVIENFNHKFRNVQIEGTIIKDFITWEKDLSTVGGEYDRDRNLIDIRYYYLNFIEGRLHTNIQYASPVPANLNSLKQFIVRSIDDLKYALCEIDNEDS